MIEYTARNGKLYKLPKFDTSKLQDGDLEILKKAREVLWDTETWEGYGTTDEKLLRSNYICNCILIATGFSKKDHYGKEKTEGTAAGRLIELVENALWIASLGKESHSTSINNLYPQKSRDELYEIRNAWLEQIINSVEAK